MFCDDNPDLCEFDSYVVHDSLDRTRYVKIHKSERFCTSRGRAMRQGRPAGAMS